MKLASKTAIVTGAARGIGFGIAQVLAREGARVIIANRAHRRCLSAAISVKKRRSKRCFPRPKRRLARWILW